MFTDSKNTALLIVTKIAGVVDAIQMIYNYSEGRKG
jgi:hypothetical protein